ncbi:DUF2178 domain-containing protein [Patescibacteria group bacterium]
MSDKQYRIARLVIVALVATVVGLGVTSNNFLVAIAGVLGGMLLMYVVRMHYGKVIVDERIDLLSGRAARASYAVTTMTLVVLALFFIVSGSQQSQPFIEGLGTAFAFVALLAVALYSLSFHHYNRKYGGDR